MNALILFALLGLGSGLVQEKDQKAVYDATRRFTISFPEQWEVYVNFDYGQFSGLWNGEPIANATLSDKCFVTVRNRPVPPGTTTEQYTKQEAARLDEILPGFLIETGRLRTGLGTSRTLLTRRDSTNVLSVLVVKDGRLWMIRASVPFKEHERFVEEVLQPIVDSMKLGVDQPKGDNVAIVRNSHFRLEYKDGSRSGTITHEQALRRKL